MADIKSIHILKAGILRIKMKRIPSRFNEFSVSDKRFGIRIGKNVFTDRGINLDIKRNNLTLKGK